MTRYYVRKSIRRWAFLEPWCAFLREHTELHVVQDLKDDLMLCVRLRPESGERLLEYDVRVRQLRVALELLTMVAFVDALAWQDLLRDKCGCAYAPFWDGWRLPLGVWLKLGDRKLPQLASFDTRFYRAFFLPFTAFADVAAPGSAASATTGDSSGDEYEYDHTGADGQLLSHTARMAMQGVLSEMTPEMHREFERHGKVEVCMRFIPSLTIDVDLISKYLQDVVDSVKQCLEFAATAQEDVTLRYMSKLTLNDVELHIGDVPLPPGSTHGLADFVALNTTTVGFYPNVDIGPRSTLGTMPLVELAPLLQAIATRVSGGNKKAASGCQVEYPVGDESFALIGSKGLASTPHTNLAQARRFKAFFSAFAVSRCFDHMHLERAIGDVSSSTRGKKWQWLAYALLSKESTAGVTKLALSESHMRQADMNAILSILNTSNPAGKLGGLCRTSEDQARLEAELELLEEDGGTEGDDLVVGDEDIEDGNIAGVNDEDPDVRAFYSAGELNEEKKRESPSSVRVRAGTTVHVDPLTAESLLNQRESFVLPVDTTFRVIDDDLRNDWVGILAPCYGYCSVPRDAAVRVECTDASRLETSISWGYRGTIRCLRLNPARPVPLVPLLPLIRYLGNKLVAFEATEAIDLSGMNLHDVLEACPHLTSLNAFLPWDTIDGELLAAYTEARCSVSNLKLISVSRAEQVSKFIRALQDPSSRAARTVEKLAMFGDSDTALDRSVLTGLLEVLESNMLLETLRVEVSLALMKEFKPLFMKFHGQVISGTNHPLPLECRCAFLSVAQYFSDDNESPPKRQRRTRTAQIEQLDRGVVALIFQFAAEPKSREVFVYEVDV